MVSRLPGRAPPPLGEAAMWAAVRHAIVSRRSVRGFLPEPVGAGTIRDLLDAAARAPSGSNVQPWRVHVLTGAALARLCAALGRAFDADVPEAPDYHYYPTKWRSPYLDRRRAVGWALYALAGIARGDRVAGKRQRALNYGFFGAPVGLVFAIDRDLERGSWLDYGMFLQSLMIAARGSGLDTCPQAAISNYPDLVRRELGIPADRMIVCGMALGRADPDVAVNALRAEREPVETFTEFHHA